MARPLLDTTPDVRVIWNQLRQTPEGPELPWFLSDKDDPDLVEKVRHSTIVVGAKTWDSIPKHKRPKCQFLILASRTWNYKPEDPRAYVCADIEGFFRHNNTTTLFVLGGNTLFREAMPYASRLYLRLLNDPENAADDGGFLTDIHKYPWKDHWSVMRTVPPVDSTLPVQTVVYIRKGQP